MSLITKLNTLQIVKQQNFYTDNSKSDNRFFIF